MAIGLIIIYTGDGKGKTTAALGLALRALGHGKSVCIVQFMKGLGMTGEVKALSCFEKASIRQFGTGTFIIKGKHTKEDVEEARKGLDFAAQVIASKLYNVVILDEICIAIDFGLISLEDVLEILMSKDRETDIVLTGRNAPTALIDLADLVTEMKCVKHPYDLGIGAKEGIDY